MSEAIPPAHVVVPARRFYESLYFQVLCAIALGIVIGHGWPEAGAACKPLGDGFIKLVKMTIAPVVFCTVVIGIAGMRDMKALGKTGGLALLYFEIVSTLALVIGLVIVNVFAPGGGMNVDPHTLDTSGLVDYTGPGKLKSTTDFLLGIIPDSLFGGFANGEVLPILFVAILFGVALHNVGERGKPVLDLVERVSAVLFKIIGMIMKVAPIGAFGAMAFTIGKYGLGTLTSLGEMMACFYGACLVFVLGVLGAIARVHGFSVLRLIAYLKDELFIVLGTSSSEAALPRMMLKLEKAGADKGVVGLVVPAGYSFNLDGTAIYLTMAAVFIAQATNTPLDLQHQLELLGVLLLTSKGAAGVTGSGFIVLGATLSAVGHVPVAGLALILGIDRFMSEARALTNIVGNAVATLVVARWVGQRDDQALATALDPRTRAIAAGD
ncbi:MAG: dicarboxylate/amino acid:cation symporter [Deltaproteobacteria bacterium]|nr:dicarboxylate/amino acid:cation symporter [Deltaproteobacteria bacterium]